MEILSEEETSDGYKLEVDLNEEETNALILAGIQSIIDEEDLDVVAKPLLNKSQLTSTDVKIHNLSSDETAVLVNLGFNKVIRDSLSKLDSKDG
jgi:hypothetical protein